MSRLGQTDAENCAQIIATPVGSSSVCASLARPGKPASLCDAAQRSFFRGFAGISIRNARKFALASSRLTSEEQFKGNLRLNSGLNVANPTVENIRKDFERFGFLFDLANADPANPARITHLGHMNFWRNHAAHQKATPPPLGVPPILILADIQVWRASCDGLATSLDDIMRKELHRILHVAPW